MLLGAALSGLARGRRAGISLLGLSFVFLLAFVEEPASLLRSVGTAPIRTARRTGTLRVVSLNCGGGLPEAAAEVERWSPDLVLLQEVPQEAEVATIARRLYGASAGVVYGFDTAIIGPGAVALRPAREHRFFVTAEVKLADGTVTQVASLRLAPPLVRMDLWSPECWRQQRENREARRAEMETLLGALSASSGEVPLIVGGDFNAPAGDAVPAMLAPRLRDSFREAGRG